MKVILKSISHTYEINKSKFICILCPYEEFEQTLINLKSEHPKARHFVYAYRYLNEHGQIVENQSDDGEPKGSSGPPVLSVLRGENLIGISAIVVRYFGGVKLGVGGLVRAYTKSVHLSLKDADDSDSISTFIKKLEIGYEISFKRLSKFEHYLKQFSNLDVKKNFLDLGVCISIKATESQHKDIEEYVNKLKNIN